MRTCLSAVLFACLSMISSAGWSQDVWMPLNNGLGALPVRAIAVDPHDGNVLYVGTVGGGVYRSTDKGQSWAASGLSGEEVTSLVIDPADSNILFAGTGSLGVQKSVDAGGSWNPVNEGLPNLAIGALAVRPDLSSILYAGVDAFGIYRSLDSGAGWAFTGGSPYILQFSIDTVDSTVGYASSTQGILKTTDGGGSWSESSFGLPNLSPFGLEVDPADPSVIYCGPYQNGVYKSTDSGQTWFASGTGLPFGAYATAIYIPRNGAAAIYIGTELGVYRSPDAGATWQALSDGLTSTNVLIGAFSGNPADPSELYVGTYGGLFGLKLGPTCGDGVCDPGENAAVCPSDCEPLCGNGVLEPGEECDDGNLNDGDGCSSTCQLETYEGKGQRADVNGFLSYVNPQVAATMLPAGTTGYEIVVKYGSTVLPDTFRAELNQVDVTPSFHPAPGGLEAVTIPLGVGRNTLILSINGIRTDGNQGSEKDRLVFIVN